MALMLTASRKSHVAMFQTNQPVCSAFRTVSLRRPSGYWLAENITIGGSKVRFCHWLYGARFSTPSGETLESQPMGRGTVQLLKGEKGRGLFSDAGSYFMVGSLRVEVGDHRWVART